MRKRLSRGCFGFLVLLVAIGFAGGQTAATQAPAAKRVLMWKVSSPTTVMYLFGSIHVGDDGSYPLPAGVETAFAASKKLIVEVNAKDMDQTRSLELVQKYGVYPQGDGLSRHVPESTTKALNEFASAHGLPANSFEQVKPWLASLTIVAVTLQQMGLDPKKGIDLHFIEELKPTQQIQELETADFQISLLSSATEAEQQKMLEATLNEADKLKDQLTALRAAYFNADGEAMLKLLREQQTAPESLLKKLVGDRNVTMAAKLNETLHGKEPAFVVVKALHILGENGLARLLASKGYKVQQMVVEGK